LSSSEVIRRKRRHVKVGNVLKQRKGNRYIHKFAILLMWLTVPVEKKRLRIIPVVLVSLKVTVIKNNYCFLTISRTVHEKQ